MNQFYKVLDKVREALMDLPTVNTVTTGNLSDIDLTKTTIFPLSHLIVENTQVNSKTITFNLRVLCMDILDQTKELSDYDLFYGNSNAQDVLNTQLLTINTIHSSLSRGNLHVDGFQTYGDLSAEPFLERFENVLAGWEGVLSISMPNNISIC
jgi:hypothetical protein